MKVPANAKYEIIKATIEESENRLSIKHLCEIACVSRSGYYHYLGTDEIRFEKEQKDKNDFALIQKAYKHKGYDKGARSIYMRLLHQEPPVCMNIKKIRRLMKKYGLRCSIRKVNPYRKISKCTALNEAVPNRVNREFEVHGPRKILLTDITYIINGKAPKCYMSTIIDAYTKELLAWVLSISLEVDFVLKTVNILHEKHGDTLAEDTILHSDQGAHYTCLEYKKLVQELEFVQSMSRRANCWDNAPQESFFGHMKDELQLSECETYEDIFSEIKRWTEYYNNQRYQWDLKKLSPVEYYEYVTTDSYPLIIPRPKGFREKV